MDCPVVGGTGRADDCRGVVVDVVAPGEVVVVVVDDESFEHAAPNSDSATTTVHTASRVIAR